LTTRRVRLDRFSSITASAISSRHWSVSAPGLQRNLHSPNKWQTSFSKRKAQKNKLNEKALRGDANTARWL